MKESRAYPQGTEEPAAKGKAKYKPEKAIEVKPRKQIKWNTELFIKKASEIHNNKFDYSKSAYTNYNSKIEIICKIHGSFMQTVDNHLHGQGCIKCKADKLRINNRSNTKDFVKKAKAIYGDFYDYSKVNYIDNKTKIEVICKKHGLFLADPNNHLSSEAGCKTCGYEVVGEKLRYSTEEYINKANEIHNNLYDYSKVKYINIRSKITIICKKHGEFIQKARDHLKPAGCQKCAICISKPECKWLDLLEIPNEFRQKSFKLNNNFYKLDAFNPKTNTIYEFYGDFWHGNPKKYKKEKLNSVSKKTFGELYRKTLEKENAFLNAGYKVVFIWESDFQNLLKFI